MSTSTGSANDNADNTFKRKFHFQHRKKYEISISFTNEYQFVQSNPVVKKEVKNLMFGLETPNDSTTRLTQFCDFIKDEYLPYFEKSKYKLYLELSDPKFIDKHGKSWKYPRLHLHGIIEWDSPIELFYWKLNIMPHVTNYGNIQFNEYRPNYWNDYIKKDHKGLKKIIKHIKENNDGLTNLKFYKNLQCYWDNINVKKDLFE